MMPNEWTIKHLYQHYAYRTEATQKYYDDGLTDYEQFCKVCETVDKEYIQAMRLIFSKRSLSFGMVLPVAEFAEEWNDGSFCDYDGVGYFLDWEGNELDTLHNFEKVPEGTRFVAWYNK